MKKSRFNNSEIENYGVEITSVSSFINEINKLKDNLVGSNEELFFRGQKVHFWNVTPSIFRDNYLNDEHTLMHLPLLKVPHEFLSINNDFEIMTKYQHYGMCTRLLDLTTNPLVALYFACEEHSNVCYEGMEENEDYSKEANGVIFFNKRYPMSINNIEIRIISALSKMDLSKDNNLESILRELKHRKIISKELEERWQSEEYYKEFIKIIQSNYIVTPSYSNERLLRQCGIFLLAGCFNYTYTESISKSIIEKGYTDLRNEFEKDFFYILGENKKRILEELDMYNINESTLFPELEHQLSYIKNKKNIKKNSLSEFTKFNFNEIDSKNLNKNNKICDNIIENNDFKYRVTEELSKYNFDIENIWILVEEWVSIVDWYKQENLLSKFKVDVKKIFLDNKFDKEYANNEAKYISEIILKIATELSERS